jgi:hypothetical protein
MAVPVGPALAHLAVSTVPFVGHVVSANFSDGIKRWVVTGGDGEACACFPAFEDDSAAHLRDQLVGVKLSRCLRVPEKQTKEEKKAVEQREALA